MQMESKDIDQIRNLLSQWLDNLTTNSNTNAIAFPTSPANFPDPVDMASAHSEMEYSFSKLCREGLNKENILNALEKIEDGSYGICEMCGEEIPIKRLKAIPDARCCIACQTELEQDEGLLIA
jgi:DnaK suppressor protein